MLSDIVESGCAVGRTSIESGRVAGASYPGVIAMSEIIKSCFFLITSKYEVLAISLCYTILFLLIRRRQWIRLHVATAFPSSVMRKKPDFGEFADYRKISVVESGRAVLAASTE